MINIVAGFGENDNIVEASLKASEIEDVDIKLVRSEDELIDAFKNPDVDAVVRGSLKASKIISYIKEYEKDCLVNRATYINTSEDTNFSKDYEFLLAPVGIDEGKTIEDKVELAFQCGNFFKSLNKKSKIAILAEGRKDDYGRNIRVDRSLDDSKILIKSIISKFESSDDFDNESKNESMNYSIKNYYILLEQAIKDGNNIILAPDGIFGNILFRSLVLLNLWPSYGAVTLGIDEVFIDTSRDQSVEGYLRSLKLAYFLAKSKNIY